MRWAVVPVLGCLLAGFFACGGDDGACVPGRTVRCACPGGATGLQTCRADGSGYEACDACEAVRAGFTDLTKELGLPDTSMSCVGFEDFDGDGKIDILVSSSGVPAFGLVYAGDGKGGFSKNPVGQVAAGAQMVCTIGDVDRDGRPDVMVGIGSFNGGTKVELWKNLGDFKFAPQPEAITIPPIFDQVIIALGLWDYDQDGWLDLFVGRLLGGSLSSDCNYTSDADFRCLLPMIPNNPAPMLFHNKNGRFEPTTGAPRDPRAGDPALAAPYPGTTNAVAFADFDRDGRTDLLMMNDWYVNHVYLRTADGKFVHGEHQLGIDEYNHGMGAAIADYDGDGRLDVFGADLGPNNLWFGQPDGTFKNRGLEVGVAQPTHYLSTWAPLGEDFDLDGLPDIFVASSGGVDSTEDMVKLATGSGQVLPGVKQFDLLFWNSGGKFTAQKLPHRPGQTPNIIFAASAAADPDGDGDLDILVAAGMPAQLRYLRNDQPPGNWLVVDLEGTTSNRDGIGAEVSLVEGGKVLQMRTLGSQGSVGSSWRRAHFGLGQRTGVEEVRVRWPSGKTQKMGPVTAKQTIRIKEE